MAKPICFLKFNEDRMMSGRGMTLPELFKQFGDMMPDYYVLCSYSDNVDGLYEVQVFHEKDFTETNYAELKKIIEDSLPKNKINNG